MTNDESNLNAQMTNDRNRSASLRFGHSIIRHSSFRRRRGAFSLFELIIVMAIIAISLAIVAPNLAGFSKRRITTETATHFVATAHFARSQAIADGCIFRLNLDPAAGRWWLTKDDGTGNFIPDTSGEGPAFSVPDSVRFESPITPVANESFIEFQPDGHTDSTTLRFLGPQDELVQVACDSPFDTYHIVPPNGGGR